MLAGRLSINIISSDIPGETMASEPATGTRETMMALRQLLNGESVALQGEFLDLEIDPPNARTVSGNSPLFYFGGLSEPARDVAAECSDVFLMWPGMLSEVDAILTDMRKRAADYTEPSTAIVFM